MRYFTLQSLALWAVCFVEAFFYFLLWRLRVALSAVAEYEEYEAPVPALRLVERPAYVPTANERAAVEYGAAEIRR